MNLYPQRPPCRVCLREIALSGISGCECRFKESIKKERFVMEKEKKLRFNIVDVIFIAVLLAGIAFVALRLSGRNIALNNGSSEEYIITFYISDSADYIVDRLYIGSPMTDDTLALNLGTLVDFETGPAQISSAAADGHLVISDREGYSSVYLMSKVYAVDNGFGVTVDGLKLQVGHSMVIRSKESKFWAYVYDIQKLENTSYAN